ncbi:MAG: pyridoxamine 5'-phosphate oxidase [Flavobacteriales bacterium]|nr:pyridoxamine 5'-phosphate oxidase [Flavobacteriales bacterium]
MLSTISKEGTPSSRIVLLKTMDKQGFVFFTNYKSNKSLDIQENPNVSLLFYWPLIERQVRITGKIEKVSLEESQNYFKTRSRKSKIGAWASKQSSVIHSKKDFQDQIARYTKKYKNKTIPCPLFWGGYRLIPSSFEFWQARVNRLHDRFIYTIKNKTWTINRLSP